MIGTPKITKMLQSEFQMAKRVSGEGEVRMSLMKEKSREWEDFLKVLWRYQFTAKPVTLTPSIKKAFFSESVGNPFIAAILYKIVQDDAIINQTESFKAADIHAVAERTLGLTAKKRRDMLEGTDVELNSYRHLWSALTPPSSTGTNDEESAAVAKRKEGMEELQRKFEQCPMQKYD